MRITAVLIISMLAGSAQAAGLPDLGTKRRVVLSEMRIAGLALLDSTGDRLDFLGGPEGLEEATTTSYHFSDLTLDEVRLTFPRRETQAQAHTLYRQIYGRLSKQLGRPQVDGLRKRNNSNALVSTWGSDGTTYTLRGDRHRDLTLVVRVGTVGGTPARRVFRASEDEGLAAWSPEQFQKRMTDAKRATDELLYELDRQRFMVWARKQKHGPVTMRLKKVTIPSSVGLDRELFATRFLYFVRGSTDLTVASRRPDIDVEIVAKPTRGGQAFDVVLVARATRGKARNRVLFTKAVTVY